MGTHPQILHVPSVARTESGWTPLTVGELVAGEFRPLPFSAPEDESIVEKVSVWRHAGGELPYARPVSAELFYLIEGRVRIEWEHDSQLEAQSGDVVVVPIGFSGTWHTLEPIVKISISTIPAVAG